MDPPRWSEDLDDRTSPADRREARVRHLMGLMAANRWDGEQLAELAERWQVAEGTVAHYAGEASRRVKAVGEQEYVRGRLAVALDAALAHGERFLLADNFRALSGVAQVARAFSELVGMKPAKDADGAAGEAVFRVELTTPERPTPECPSGPSSPPGGDPAPG